MILPPALFSRASTAYKDDGSAVAAGEPRYETLGGRQGVMVEAGATNLLTVNQASVETDLAGIGKNIGTETHARTTAEYWSGAACLQVQTTSNGSEGFFTSATGCSPSQSYTASVWLKGAGTVLLRIVEIDVGLGIVGSTFSALITLTAQWTRYTVSRTFGASGVYMRMMVTNSPPQTVTWYADGMQIEQKAYPTSWQLPGTARAAESLSFDPAPVVTPEAGALALWVYVDSKIKKNGISTSQMFWHATAGNENRISLERSNTSNLWYAVIANAAGTTSTSQKADALADGWHRIGMRWSAAELCVFVDGVKGTPAASPNLPSALAALAYIGQTSNAVLDDVSFWRRALTDADFTADYNGLQPSREAYATLSFNGTLEVTMSTNIRQEIIDALDARLKTILVANGYLTNLGQNVAEWDTTPHDPAGATLLEYRDEEAGREDVAVGVQDMILLVTLRVRTAGAAALTDMRNMLADVCTAMHADPTWGGLAGDTVQAGAAMADKAQDKDVAAGFEVKFRIDYTVYRGGS
jgi:hypothetical protein